MNVVPIEKSTGWFEILQTTEKSQTAMMTLGEGEATSEKLNVHPKSDQVVMLLEGELVAEVGEERRSLRTGDVVIVPAGTPHKFTNPKPAQARAFSVYAPPAYPPGGE